MMASAGHCSVRVSVGLHHILVRKAQTHLSPSERADLWVAAFTGTTVFGRGQAKLNSWPSGSVMWKKRSPHSASCAPRGGFSPTLPSPASRGGLKRGDRSCPMAAPDPITDERPLAGRRIALVEHRELDRLGRMLEELGAETLRCPLVAIADAPDQAAVRAWIERAIAVPFEDLVLMTGEGLRRLRGAAERAGLEAGFRDALARMRTITRGPKPARA